MLNVKETLDFYHFTIEAIAKRYNVSKTHVHRFYQKLGYNSFKLFGNVFFYYNENSKSIDNSKSLRLACIEESYTLSEAYITDAIIHKMIRTKRITIYGIGMSNLLGKMFQIKLQLLGKNAVQSVDSRFMRLPTRALVHNDILFFAPAKWQTSEVVEAVVEATLRDVDVVLIKEAIESLRGHLATHYIQTAQSSNPDSAVDTRLYAHIAMDCVMRHYIQENENEVV